MAIIISPMNLGDIFDQTFRLFGKTFARNFILALLILTPALLIVTWGLDRLFSAFSDWSQSGALRETAGPAAMMRLLSMMSTFSIAVLIYLLLDLAASLGVTIISCHEMNGQPLTWNDALTMTFSMRLARAVGQIILQYLAIGALLIIPYAALIAGMVIKLKTLALLGGLVMLLTIGAAIHLAVRWAFTLPAIACEEAGVFQSFTRSSMLVQGLWWRTLGILILLTLIVQFAMSIVTTPLSFLALRDFYSRMFEMMGGAGDPAQMAFSLKTFGKGLALVIGVSAILTVLISPLIRVVMYFDLRARQGEFSPAPPA